MPIVSEYDPSRAPHCAPSQPIATVLKRAVDGGHLSDANPVAVFYDVAQFTAECKALVAAFPSSTLHGFAVKACPIVGILRAAAAAGMGGECASEGEVALCVAAGLPPERIVFDSPAKTDTHLVAAISSALHINADSFDEVERIDSILRTRCITHPNAPRPVVGLRINPQTGAGTIAMTSTAGAANKFGVPLRERRAEIIAVFELYEFLSCVHVHVGSQGCSPEALIAGIEAAVELADEINTKAPNRVTAIDIGGGLSVDYGNGNATVLAYDEYVQLLRDRVPRLFHYRIITEFGRRLSARTAFIAARVQAIKTSGRKRYLVCHAGADLLVRPVYAPDKWRNRIEVRSPRGTIKSPGPTAKFDVAGPLCFSGDIIGTDRVLPEPQIGDIVVILDSGAYTLAMYSRHTSQLVPPVYGYGRGLGLDLLKKRETLEDLVRFWGGDPSLLNR